MGKLFLMAVLIFTVGSVNADLIGSWNLNGDFENELVGESALVTNGDASSTVFFTSDTIAGSTAEVLSFPAFPGGYTDYVGMPNDSGLSICSNYTLIMDIKYPSLPNYACIYDFGYETGDGDYFVHNNGLGVRGKYQGTFTNDVWYRIALVAQYNANNDNIIWSKYIDGSLVGTQALDNAVRYSIYNELRLFVDNDGETAAGLLNSLAFWNETLSGPAIAGYGAASADGIAVPEPASVILILTALAGLLIRR